MLSSLASAAVATIVVLTDTGVVQDHLPVVKPHPDAQRYVDVLERGFSGRLLRLYRLEQRLTHPDREPRPAYLVLTQNEGGFPRWGFVLDGHRIDDAAYVDLRDGMSIAGEFGAIDQIFPHELLHIIVRDLAGEAPIGPSRQIHAIGVRTDRPTAFDEGFAEHAQIMAIDDPDAVASTRALASDAQARAGALRWMDAYRRALTARWAIAPRARMLFPLWFSRSEQALRYSAVKENRYAFEVDLPDRLDESPDPYAAYLLENIVPGDGPHPKGAARALASESVVSALCWRLVNSVELRSRYREPEFYGRFDTAPGRVDGTDNIYLKLFEAIRVGRYDAADVIRAYGRLFPDEHRGVLDVTRAVLNRQDLPAGPEIWMLNDRFQTGTSVFDQFRSRPRPHAFDLNAASRADLAGVAGMTSGLSSAIRARAPYRSIADLGQVPGMSATLVREFGRLHDAMERVRSRTSDDEATLTVRTVLMPYLRRAVLVWLLASVAAALLYRAIRRLRWWRAVLDGAAATLVSLLVGWATSAWPYVLPLVAPVVLFGVPAAVWQLLRRRSVAAAAEVLGAWTVAALAGYVSVVPIG